MTPETKEMCESTEENITELVEFKKATVLAAFSSKEGLDSVVSDTAKLVDSFNHDMSTGASRARTASLAAKVSKLKVKLDGLGKDLVSDWKTKAKSVDSSRKRMRDDLDELKVLARKPLTDWEGEEAAKVEAERVEAERLEAERVTKEFDDKLAADIEVGHELGLLLNAEHDREVQAEVDRKAADAADAAENSRLAEVKRQKDEAAHVEADRIQREKDKKYMSSIMRETKETLMKFAEIDEETARRVVTAIKNGVINNVSIQF